MNRFKSRMAVTALALLIGTATAQAESTIYHLKLSGPLPEAPMMGGFEVFMGGEQPLSMFQLLERLNKARKDPEVRALVLDVDNAALSLAQVQEIRDQIGRLRAAEKDVWVFTEGLTMRNYALASAAGRIIMLPSGELLLEGMHGEGMYFKNLLDKIHVKADIIHIGDFKSAGEPFYREGPSDEAKSQQEKLIGGLFDSTVEMIAESRKLTPDKVRSFIDKAIFSPQEAVDAGLVDELMYRQDLRKALKNKYGHDVEITRNYGVEDPLEIDFNNPMAFFEVFSKLMNPSAGKEKRDTIAVVYVDSAITSGKTEQSPFGGGPSNSGSDTVAAAIDLAAKMDNVKALVLRVDSPGGSAVASDVICEAVKRLKEKGKPVIVSMGGVAASGGYYVSALADQIFADETTITGSIGVVGGKIVTKGMWDWIGITTHEFSRGARAGMFSTSTEFSADERKVITDMMLRVYGDFKQRVVDGRGSKIKGDLEPLAGGRVYTGRQALEIGLVDTMGGLNDAVLAARSAANLDRFELEVLPRPKTLADLLRQVFGEVDEDEELEIRVQRGSTLSEISAMLPTLYAIDPIKAVAVQRAMLQLQMLGHERVLMADPSLPVFGR